VYGRVRVRCISTTTPFDVNHLRTDKPSGFLWPPRVPVPAPRWAPRCPVPHCALPLPLPRVTVESGEWVRGMRYRCVCVASPRSCERLPARPQPPRTPGVGGWEAPAGRGGFAPATPRRPRAVGAQHSHPGWWCEGGRYIKRPAAPGHWGAAHGPRSRENGFETSPLGELGTKTQTTSYSLDIRGVIVVLLCTT
jgi:hypothetical protein